MKKGVTGSSMGGRFWMQVECRQAMYSHEFGIAYCHSIMFTNILRPDAESCLNREARVPFNAQLLPLNIPAPSLKAI